MAKTYIDQIVEYPAKVMQRIAEDEQCVAFLVDKEKESISDDDKDYAITEKIFDYQYVDDTVQETGAFIWVEMEIDRVDNKQIKDTKVYVTIACHQDYMKLNRKKFKGIIGNRRDNLVRFVDKILNNTTFLGIGALKLENVRTLSPIKGFKMREITYSVPDFNIVEIDE